MKEDCDAASRVGAIGFLWFGGGDGQILLRTGEAALPTARGRWRACSLASAFTIQQRLRSSCCCSRAWRSLLAIYQCGERRKWIRWWRSDTNEPILDFRFWILD